MTNTEPNFNVYIPQILAKLRGIVFDKKTTTPMQLIAQGMEILDSFKHLQGIDKKILLIACLQEVAAGKDGLEGTSDDIIPFSVVEGVSAMLELNLVNDVIDVFSAFSKGEYDVNRITEVAQKSVSCFAACFGKRESGYKK